jgi:hydrogenase-4 component E
MWVDVVLITLTLMNLILLGASRLTAAIRIIVYQGIVLGLMPLLIHGFALDLLLFTILTVSVKGILLPAWLWRTVSRLDVNWRDVPYIGYGASILIGPLALALALWLSSRLILPPQAAAISAMIVPVALFTVLVGFFLIISRKKALSQIIGYIVLENGIYTFGIAFAIHQPLLIEMGILLDVFVGVFVMCITLTHIGQKFDHIDTDRLSALRN